jgi:putative ABC transport system permease protein
MPTLLQEMRIAARSLLRTPAFAIIVVATLALGIGANTAIFGIVNAVLLRPLGYAAPERLAVLWETMPGADAAPMFASPPNFVDWRANVRAFEGVGAFAPRETFLLLEDATVRLDGARVSAGLFEVLGVRPLTGRGLTADDDRAEAAPVALLSHRVWRDRFGADPSLVGRTLTFDDVPRTVIGIMPPGFDFPPPIDLEGPAAPRRSDVWVPFGWDYGTTSRSAHFMTVVGRLAPDATHASAEADLRAVAANLARAYPASNADWSARVVPFEEVVMGDARLALVVLLGAVGAVLLIACVNIANLLLARSAARQKEYAVRAALGAARWPLLRQAIVESQLLALTGGAAGLLVAYATMGAIVRMAPANVPRLADASIDPVVIGFTALLAVVTGLLFGLAPAVRALSPDLAQWLRQGGRSAGQDGVRVHARNALVVAEVALSLVLLVGAGLLFNSFLRLRGVDTGFSARNVATMRLNLSRQHYPETTQVVQTYAELERRIQSIPGVEAAGFSRDVPLAGDFQGTELILEGETPAASPDDAKLTHFSIVTPGYFDAMGIPVVSGRGFRAGDAVEGAAPVVVNARSAALYFDGRDPVGQRVTSFGDPRPIVGVVGDVRLESMADDPTPALYFMHADQGQYRSLSLVVRSQLDAAGILDAVVREVHALDPRIPVYDARTLEQVVAQAVAQPRFSTALLLVFSGLALVLAAVGIYGVVSYAVGQRTRELGVRMALGARPLDALRLVLRDGMRPVAAGVAIGLVASLWLTRGLRSLLFEITPTDPATLAIVCAFLLAIAAVACWIPARRASRVDPMVALRAD